MPRMMLAHERPAVAPEVAVDWWADQGAPWFDDDIVDRPVDAERTAGLRTLITGEARRDRVRLGDSTPLQHAAARNTTVHTWPYTGSHKVPLPELVWHNGFGNPDQQWFGVDEVRGLYWEVSSIRTGFFGWWSHYVRRHDLNGPWNAVRSISGAAIPVWAMIPSTHGITEMAGVQSAVNFVVGGGYSTDKVDWVVKSDGGLSRSHPLRAGERLRLTAEAFDRRMAEATTAAQRGLVWRLRYRGAIVNDKTAATEGHNIRLAYGSDVRDMELHLLDFEVVYTP